jgi:hypothetical protein
MYVNEITYIGFEVFTAVTVKNSVFRAIMPSGSFRTDISEERIESIIRVKESAS